MTPKKEKVREGGGEEEGRRGGGEGGGRVGGSWFWNYVDTLRFQLGPAWLTKLIK